jgi:L-threonylcarbamoyladenylate synthase
MSLKDFLKSPGKWKLLQDSIVIYPTDTVYGLGCDARNEELVEKIFEIKRRDKTKTMSVIAPSFEWILENCEVKNVSLLRKLLPGPYTVILKKKQHDFLAKVASGDSIGIRIPRHAITQVFQKLNLPFVTTSANISGEKSPACIEEISHEILEKSRYYHRWRKAPRKTFYAS